MKNLTQTPMVAGIQLLTIYNKRMAYTKTLNLTTLTTLLLNHMLTYTTSQNNKRKNLMCYINK